ncbi:TPA: Na+/H+ antiporter Mnh2 subunit G, partial [Staphylococcus aureus]|nr:Na+/H+ antiporter Mnh2 subunit G [Staphylococcus aureus]
KNDDHTHASILLSSNEQNSTEALQLRAKKREEHRKKWYQND